MQTEKGERCATNDSVCSFCLLVCDCAARVLYHLVHPRVGLPQVVSDMVDGIWTRVGNTPWFIQWLLKKERILNCFRSS